MDDSLEYPEDGLRNRIRAGFEEKKSDEFEKTNGRPKTPGGGKRKTVLKKTVDVPHDEKQTDEKPDAEKSTDKKKMTKPVATKPVAKKPVAKKPVVRKPRVEFIEGDVPPAKKTPVKKNTPSDAVYLCLHCDKTYKSKSGVVKHMEKCKNPK
jgi:hypothetical protein